MFRYSSSASKKAAGNFMYHSMEYMLSSSLLFIHFKGKCENVDVSDIVDACYNNF